MAKKSQKSAKPKASSASTSASQTKVPPAQLMNLVESFLSDQGFDNAHREFQKHRAKKGWKDQETGKSKSKEHHSLVSVFQTWKTFASQGNTPVLVKEDPMEKITKVSSSSDSDSSDESSSESESDDEGPEDATMADAPTSEESSSSESSSSEDSDSESESDEEESKPTTSTTGTAQATSNPRKRKAESDSESSSDSDSDEDMSDSSSDDGRPQTKKAKTSDSSDESSSSSDSSDSESSEDEDEVKSKGAKKSQTKEEASSSESESESESESDSSDSESDAEPEVDLKAAAAVPLPDSDSSSASESESDSDSDDEKPQQRTQEKVMNGAGSDTSATLDKTSPDTTYPPLPPDPSTLKTNNRGKNGVKANKAQNQPFSRIRNDVAIDPRLSSNAYVSHGYGEKAHQDLIVTKGKGFTKEKNKKKRGSYKGGPLDIHQSRSIKFED